MVFRGQDTNTSGIPHYETCALRDCAHFPSPLSLLYLSKERETHRGPAQVVMQSTATRHKLFFWPSEQPLSNFYKSKISESSNCNVSLLERGSQIAHTLGLGRWIVWLHFTRHINENSPYEKRGRERCSTYPPSRERSNVVSCRPRP